MEISKKGDTYNMYRLDVSFGELIAMTTALENNQSGKPDPVADECLAAMKWYVQQIPGPGEDSADHKAAKKAEKDARGAAEKASEETGEIPAETKPNHGLSPEARKVADETIPEPPTDSGPAEDDI